MSDRSPTRWRATSAWAHVAQAGRGGDPGRQAGIRLELIQGRSLATIVEIAGQEARLDVALRACADGEVPGPGKVEFGRICDLVWSAPGQWLAIGSRDQLAENLRDRLKGVAAVSDQSDSRAVLRCSGRHMRDALASGVAIDLDPSVFTVGSAAVTRVAHLSVQIWQVDGVSQADPVPTFMIAIPRSFAGSFWSWISAACAPFGYDVVVESAD